MPRIVGSGSLTALIVAMLFALSGSQALASHVQCGDVITQDTTLDSDLADCPGDGIVIGASDITLDLAGHTVDGDGRSFPDDPCEMGIVSGPRPWCSSNTDGAHARVSIRGGGVRDFDYGVALIGTARSAVRDVTVTGAAEAISLWQSDDSLVSGSHVFDSGYGIVVADSSGNRILRNLARRTGAGIYADGADENRFEWNVLSGNAYGFSMNSAQGNRVALNVVSGNRDVGIDVSDGVRENQIIENRLSGNRTGILMWEGANHNLIARNRVSGARDGSVGVGTTGILSEGPNRIEENAVSGRQTGIFIVAGAEGARLTHNQVVRNGTAVLVEAGDTRVEENRIGHNTADGIVVRPHEWSSGQVHIERNHVSFNGGDGILMGRHTGLTAGRDFVSGNDSNHNGDDGIDVLEPATVVFRNHANRNVELGIDVVQGVEDGGGNRASGNGDPLQCLNIACR